jgi:hypothetical protein
VNLRRKLALAGVASLLCGGAAVAAASPAFASETISGTVTCFYGNDSVDGVWVSTSNGTSGYAHLSGNGAGQQTYSYGGVNASGTYNLHVSCGGTTQNWGITYYTGPVSGTYYDWVCSSSGGCVES